MIRCIPSRILAVIVLLAYLLSPMEAGAWYCEGRQCGVTLWNCCCTTESGQDEKCNLPSSPKSVASACSSGCGCVMVDAPNSLIAVSKGFALDTPFVATLPLSPTLYIAPSCEKPVRYPIATRGSPPSSLPFLPLGLRAPPIA